ncbi:MAG: WD40/YVTN/BNR-like repeat-containing protein, partial [Chitinophagales bacterium]
MKKLFKVFFVGLYTTNLFSQTTQDTINNPYWMDMMYRRDVNFYQTQRAFNLYFSDKEKIRGTGYKQFERWAENAKREINADGSFRPADFLLKELSKFKSNSLTPRSGNPKWTSLGPFNNPAPANMQRGVGRVNVIAFHPTDPNILYCGAPSGGLWYTKDKAQSWIMSNTDNLPRFGVSSIAVIPEANSTPIVLAGTGDRDANDAPGLGVYVSMDGGVNFSPSNTGMGNKVVNRLLVNYLDNNVIVAATSDGIY